MRIVRVNRQNALRDTKGSFPTVYRMGVFDSMIQAHGFPLRRKQIEPIGRIATSAAVRQRGVAPGSVA